MMGRPPDASPAPGGAGKKCSQASPAPATLPPKNARVDKEGCSRTRPLKAKPCQVPDVTTTDTKSEQHNNGCSIPVGIAVARQRIQPYTPPLDGERVSYLAAGSQTCLTSMCQQQLTPQQPLCQPLPSWAPLQPHWHHPQPAFQDGCAAVPPMSPQYFLLPSGLVAETRSAVVWGGGQLQGLQVVAPQPLLVGHLDRHRLPRHDHPPVTGMMVDVAKGSERQSGEMVMVGGQEHQQVLVSSQLVEQHQQGFVLSGAPPPPALVPVHTPDAFHQLPHLVISHTQTNSFLRSDLNTTTVFPVNSNIVIKEENCSDINEPKVVTKCMSQPETEECGGGDGRSKVADASNQTDSPPAAPPVSPAAPPDPPASASTPAIEVADTKPEVTIKIEATDNCNDTPPVKKATDWVRDARLVCQADQHQGTVDIKPIIPPPVQPDLSGLELLSNFIIQLENREPEKARLKTPEKRPPSPPRPIVVTPPTPPPSTLARPPTPEDPLMDGLGLLCQAADMFEESARLTSSSPVHPSPPSSPPLLSENKVKIIAQSSPPPSIKVKKLSPLMRPVASPPVSPPPILESPRKRPGRPPKKQPSSNGGDFLLLPGPPVLELSAPSPGPPSPSRLSPPMLSPCKRKHPSSSDELEKGRDDKIKKRKVGRPRKRDDTPDGTETLVSNIRPSKAMNLLLGATHDSQDRPQHHKIRPKLKAEAKIKSYNDDDDELFETKLEDDEEVLKKLPSKKPTISVPAVVPPRPEPLPRLKPVIPPKPATPKEILIPKPVPKPPSSPAKLSHPPVKLVLPIKAFTSPEKVPVVNEKTEPLPTKATPPPVTNTAPPAIKIAAKQLLPQASSPQPASPAPKPSPAKQAPPKETVLAKVEPSAPPPISAPVVEGAPSCRLTEEVLSTVEMPVRVLYSDNGLFYPGTLSEITAPDLYSVSLDNERARRPNILAREQIITDTMMEVKVDGLRLVAGTRLCALWSQQYNCLYPGVAAETAEPADEHVIVEFDDGDRGSITRNHLRLLPPDFPLVMCDKNPLHGIGPRKRQSSTSVDSHSRNNSEPPAVAKPVAVLKVKEEEKENELRTKEEKKKVDSSKVILTDERRKLKKKKKMELKKLLDENIWQKLQTYKRNRKELMKHRHKHKHKHKKHKHRRDKSSDGSGSGSIDLDERFDVKDAAVLPPMAWKSDSDQQAESVVSNDEDIDMCEQSRSTDAPFEEDADISQGAQDSDEDQKDLEEGDKDDDEEEEEEEEIEEDVSTPKKVKEKERRRSSTESKSAMGHFIESQQFWEWSGRATKRKRKTHYNSMRRNDEIINVGDCAVFLSTSHPDRPYIGRIEALWETPWASKVRVRWFYHPQETTAPPPALVLPGGLFESDHIDENDVQTVSHKCRVMELPEYRDLILVEPSLAAQEPLESRDTYYVAGFYDAKRRELELVPGAAAPAARRRN